MKRRPVLPTALLFCTVAAGAEPPAVRSLDDLSAVDIVSAAYRNAGGDEWLKPSSLLMEGYGLFWRESEQYVRYEPYRMWRVYPTRKVDAHAADGRVRIDAMRNEEIVFQIAFDGVNTYNQDGLLEDSPDSDRWASNFGFGVIRHALDDGYSVHRLPDDLVDGQQAYTVQVTDGKGGTTLFNIRHGDFAIVSVGFETPRGWHRRIYSDFFRKRDGGWLQPGRVRLYYNGVKANEIYWTRFEIDAEYPVELFRLGAD